MLTLACMHVRVRIFTMVCMHVRVRIFTLVCMHVRVHMLTLVCLHVWCAHAHPGMHTSACAHTQINQSV